METDDLALSVLSESKTSEDDQRGQKDTGHTHTHTPYKAESCPNKCGSELPWLALSYVTQASLVLTTFLP